ncbi:LPD7 domain-containing protein [Candidatus Methylospira mobilis]|uniref:LPD7 domain-containing protein n=1 Tax=Candidatus Methylospira mobilis TaxID=1808979 RepID=UPI0028E940E4|nr:LPD7 domain-containing protein [Candidatus Methylospira mobilis]WNV05916.1 LPD7 domain-containing protein [Candidatus Methylospira mobilis]
MLNEDALNRALERWPDWQKPFLVPDSGYGDWQWRHNRQKALTVTEKTVQCFSEEDDAVRASLIKAMSQFEVPHVSGTQEFRRKAWFMAQDIGMEIKGYKPTAEDLALRAKIAQEQAAAAAELGANSASTAAPQPIPAQNGFTEHGSQSALDEKPPTLQPATSPQPADLKAKANQLGIGVLIEHGAAPYKHDEKNKKDKPSYYARVLNNEGQIEEFWGVDLARCLAESGVKIGDRIELKRDGAKEVSVPKLDAKGIPINDEHGKPVMITTNRNTWKATLVDADNKPVMPLRQEKPERIIEHGIAKGAEQEIQKLEEIDVDHQAALRDEQLLAQREAEFLAHEEHLARKQANDDDDNWAPSP